jgi:hypothetical protein
MREIARSRKGPAGLLVCLLVGTGVVLAASGLNWLRKGIDQGGVELMIAAVSVTLLSLAAALVLYIPYGFIALGWLRIGQHDRDELERLPDDNTVGDPVEGEKQFHQWLSGVNSMEAFFGMVPRSEPYVPPEERPPPDARVPRSRLNRTGWNVLGGTLVAGVIAGMMVGNSHGLGAGGESGQGLVQLIVSGLVGLVMSLPFAVTLALLIGRVEYEDEDDTGAGGPEAA